MSRYFLTKLGIEGFRGINNEGHPFELRFDPKKVNSIYAENGAGKSSLFDALSFAIGGDIPKLKTLLPSEKPEQYYVNKFHGTGAALIALEFTDDSTGAITSIEVRRTRQGGRTVTSPSGHANPNKFLESLNESFVLLDYQSFLKFIDESPLNRGRSFAALLGLGQYSDIRQALQAVTDTRTLDSELQMTSLRGSVSNLKAKSLLAFERIGTEYQKISGNVFPQEGPLETCETSVLETLSENPLIGSLIVGKRLHEIDFGEVHSVLEGAEGSVEHREFFELTEKVRLLNEIGSPDPKIEAEFEELAQLVRELGELLDVTRGRHFKQLYDAAESLLKGGDWSNSNQCPLCESNLAHPIDEIIQNQHKQYDLVSAKSVEIQEMWDRSCIRLRMSSLLMQGLSVTGDVRGVFEMVEDRVRLGTIMMKELTQLKEEYRRIESVYASQLQSVSDRKMIAEQGMSFSLVKLAGQVAAAQTLCAGLKEYRETLNSHRSESKRLALRDKWKLFILNASRTYAEAEARMSSQRIAAIDSEYKSMFAQLMHSPSIVPELKRAELKEDLEVQLSDFYGHANLSARALLSESYRNALAISVFFAAAMRYQGAPRFIVLDDVTSSFDAGHQFNLMELIRAQLQNGNRPDGLQFIVLSHDGLLKKYFDRLNDGTDWRHHKLEGASPRGNILGEHQDLEHLRASAEAFLNAGKLDSAAPLIRQYLEFKLLQLIRKLKIPVSIDFALKDDMHEVNRCLEAITVAVNLNERAGALIIEPNQVSDLRRIHGPAIAANYLSHYETQSGASISVAMHRSFLQSIDNYCDCFMWDKPQPNGATQRILVQSLSKKE